MTRNTTTTIVNTNKGYIQEQITKKGLAVPLYILFDKDNNFIESSIFFNELQIKLQSF